MTHLFIEMKNAECVRGLLHHGVMCLQPLYIGAYLLNVGLTNSLFTPIGEKANAKIEVTVLKLRVNNTIGIC